MRRSEFTLHGHSVHCGLCSLRVYGLWVAEEAPPIGCSNGLDSAPWTCGHVITSVGLGAMRVHKMGGSWLPHHELIRKIIGKDRFDAIVAHVLEHHSPPKAAAPREPIYDARPN